MIKSKNFKRFSVQKKEYHQILAHFKRVLMDRDDIIFAYLHGSFLNMDNFGDIDLAVYLKGVQEGDYLKHEFDLEDSLKKNVHYPLDIKVLNNTPPSFRYKVIKNGLRLVDKEENCRVDFETMTLKQYFDFLPFRKLYFKEALEGEV